MDRSKLYGTAYIYIYIYICTVRSGMDFGPANVPAVIDSPCLNHPEEMAIDFLYADLANSNIEFPTGNCLAAYSRLMGRMISTEVHKFKEFP